MNLIIYLLLGLSSPAHAKVDPTMVTQTNVLSSTIVVVAQDGNTTPLPMLTNSTITIQSLNGNSTALPISGVFNQGSYTVTTGTGSWDGKVLGSVTVTPGTGTYIIGGSATVTPGTGTWTTNQFASYVVTAGTGVFNVAGGTVTIQTPNGNTTAIPISGSISCTNCSSSGGGSNTGVYQSSPSFTVTPGTGTWNTGGSSVAASQIGSYTVTPGTGNWNGFVLGSVTITPGTGTYAVGGSVTVTPGTGTWNNGSYTVTPGSGAWNTAGSSVAAAQIGSYTVTPGTGNWNGFILGSVTVTPGTGTYQTNGTTMSIVDGAGVVRAWGFGVGSASAPVIVQNIIQTQSGNKITFATTTATITGGTAVSSTVLLAVWHPATVTKKYTLARLDISQRGLGSATGTQRLEIFKIYGPIPTGGQQCAATVCTAVSMDEDDPATGATTMTLPTTVSTVFASSGSYWATDLNPGTTTSALIGDAILGMHRAGKYPILRANRAEGWAIVQKVEAAIVGAPKFILSIWWTEE